MVTFTLRHGDSGENVIHVLPNLQKDRVIDLQMYLEVDPLNTDEEEEYILPFGYTDVVLLRDYLTSVINVYEKTGRENEESIE